MKDVILKGTKGYYVPDIPIPAGKIEFVVKNDTLRSAVSVVVVPVLGNNPITILMSSAVFTESKKSVNAGIPKIKIKTIKKEKDLIAGPYIRAVINCRGAFWIEYQVLRGRVYTEQSKYLGRVRKIKGLRTRNCYYPGHHWYLRSLSDEFAAPAMDHIGPFKIVLIPFSNKVWNYLKDLVARGNLRDFAQATNGRLSTDEEYETFDRYLKAVFGLRINESIPTGPVLI